MVKLKFISKETFIFNYSAVEEECKEEILIFPQDNKISVTFPTTKAGYFTNSKENCSTSPSQCK